MRRSAETVTVTVAVAVTVAAALACAGVLGCGHHESEPAPGKVAVRCAAVEQITVADAIELRGSVSALPDRDAQVAPQVAGRILRVLVREGDRVTAGQLVARLDDALLVDQAREAEAARAKTVAEAKNAESTLARTRRVFEHGIAARQEVDDATARAETAGAAQQETEAAVQRARRQVDRANVRSPLAGLVVRVFRRSGELVDGTPATPVLEVADPSRLELVCDASAADLVRLAKGQRASITMSPLPGQSWSGSVAAVSPGVDRATGLGTARIAIELGAGARPPIGVLGTARIEVGRPRQVPAVPKQAVRGGASGGAEVVVCGGDGNAHVKTVRPGATAGDRVEVQGLAPGERVAVQPVVGLSDGQPIEGTR